MKKPAAVVAAEAALEAKKAQLTAAKEALARLESEYQEAREEVRRAQTLADADLPQCRMVVLQWSSGRETGSTPAVISRRTPGGMLVVRCVGDAAGEEHKFKWSRHNGAFTQVERRGSWVSDRRELRDVPAEYLPTAQEA